MNGTEGQAGRGPAATASTRDLIAGARDGDREALERLLVRYRPRLMRWARGRLPASARRRLETEDLVQETLVAVVRQLDHFEPRGGGAFPAYLRRALENRVRDEIRHAGRRPAETRPVEAPGPPSDSLLQQALGRRALDAYESALGRLSDAEREAVVGRVEMGLSYAELAEVLGKASADAARMSVARALVKLARKMGVEQR